MSDYVTSYRQQAARLEAAGINTFPHDACGVGLIAALDGKPRREVEQAGIGALKAVWHRGAVDADGKTGDGAGIHVQIPQAFSATRSPAPGTSRRWGRSPSARFS